MTDKRKAYDEGLAAYHSGKSLNNNPYKKFSLRSAWSYGYQDAIAEIRGEDIVGPPR